MSGERKIDIGRDAAGNVIITGDGNLVVVQTARALEVEAALVARTAIGPNPYRGLEVFREEHADRYFGRATLVDKLWTTFRDLHRPSVDGSSPLRLLPIIGPSGCGKSSLARAGLIAELARRPLPGRSEARVGVITPGDHPIEALALVLARIATDDLTPVGKTAEFARRLREPSPAAEFDGLRFIADLLPEIATRPLILLVDQFEEAYSLCDDTAERDAFIGNLLHAAGAASARVSVLLTLRSDFLGATSRHPALSSALAERAMLVPAMSEAELRSTVEQPARNAGHPIDPATVELLVAETAGREGALPLLQFVLSRIWEGMAAGTAPADTVKALGGVGGALATEAQQLYDALPEADKRIARRAFLAMVRLGEGTFDTRRRASLPEIIGQGEDPERVLKVLRTFSQPDKRLVTLSSAADSVGTAEVTHEALLEDWTQLRDWLAAGRDDLRFHRRLAEAAAHWDAQGRPHGLLWRRPDLDLLREYHARAAADMTATQVAFFGASARQHQRARVLRQAAIAGLAGLVVVAAAFGIYAENQRRIADVARIDAEAARGEAETMRDQAEQAVDRATQQRNRADAEAERAIAERNRALVTQSRFLAELSLKETAGGNVTNGILLALEGLPASLADVDRPYVAEAEAALYAALTEIWEPLVLSGHDDAVLSAAFSPDGQRVVTASADNTARLWDAASGQSLAVLSGHEDTVRSAAFSPDGQRVVTASADETARLWDAASGKSLAVLSGHQGTVWSAAFSPDGQRVVTASADKTARLWDAASGKSLAVLSGHDDTVWSAAFSPDGQRVVTASADMAARLWDAATGKSLAVLSGHEDTVLSAAFSPDGQRVVTASWDKTARLWDAATGKSLAVLIGHKDTVRSAAFSPDGQRVATASADKAARLWDTASGRSLAVLSGHEGEVAAAAFSPDGQRVVTASWDKTARLWPVFPSGQALIDFAKSIVPHQLTPEQRKLFFLDAN